MSILKEKKLLTKENFQLDSNKSEKFYPRCDCSVWLRSCEKEILKPISGKVQGHIPIWLSGNLLRNGPGNLNVDKMRFHHLFDSAALLHKFKIKNGNVSYQCRFIETDSYKSNMAAKRIVVTSYGTATVPDPCQTIFQKIASFFVSDPINDNTNISIYPLGDAFYTFTESPIIHRINIDTLETMEKRDIRQYIGIVNHTSHPHIMADGSAYNLGLLIQNNSTQYNVVHFPQGEKTFENACVVAEISARWQLNPSYMHSFAVTDNYFIIIEQPLSISMIESIKSKYLKRPLASIFKWFQNECTLFHVISRTKNEEKYTFKTSSFFYLHTINAFDDQENVIVDICCYRDPSVLDCMYIEAMENMQLIKNYAKMFRSRPLRFILPIKCAIKTCNQQMTSPWNFLKTFISQASQANIEQYLQNEQSTGSIIDSQKCNENFWNDFESRYLVKNLINYKSSQCRAYFTDDSAIYCIPERLCNLGCETPRINDKFLGKIYQYFYAISSDVDADIPGTIIKVDTKNKTAFTWNEYNIYPSEPIFVLSPDAQSEDDGILLSSIIWGKTMTNRVGLLILCAKTLKEIGRYVFETNSPVPKCLHGWFTPSL